MSGRDPGVLRVPDSFWSRSDVYGALGRRDFGALFRLLAKYVGISQTQIAIAVGMTQGQVSTVMSGTRRLTAIDVIERALDGLGTTDAARIACGLAPRHIGADTRPAEFTLSTAGALSDTWGRSDYGEKMADGDVHRRDVLKLGAVLTMGAASATHSTDKSLVRVARALTRYDLADECARKVDRVPTLPELARAVATAKRNYQACRYTTVLNELPGLLNAAELACVAAVGDDLLRAYGLAADAYQVTGSVMLKVGDVGLAAVAADRSMEAAARSQDPIIQAASARSLTHSLMSDGHAKRAAEVATLAAERLDHAVPRPSAEAISVYGALILRGSIAAATEDRRDAAAQLLDEAQEAARRLGRDDNAHWTGFGPTNVAVHRVNVAVLLGDAGTALHIARGIDMASIQLVERQAALCIDTAQAFAQWGKHQQALDALRSADSIAPEELRTRRSVHALVRDLAAHAPHSLKIKAVDFAQQIGVGV